MSKPASVTHQIRSRVIQFICALRGLGYERQVWLSIQRVGKWLLLLERFPGYRGPKSTLNSQSYCDLLRCWFLRVALLGKLRSRFEPGLLLTADEALLTSCQRKTSLHNIR